MNTNNIQAAMNQLGNLSGASLVLLIILIVIGLIISPWVTIALIVAFLLSPFVAVAALIGIIFIFLISLISGGTFLAMTPNFLQNIVKQ